ncbi:N-acetylmuramoyl-L-alanine amidase [Halalkalibacterium halodurans]|uniref:peptidoglycan recognition protein family protein n=1 Tax=Halalkalibacterium halodurans TaxID=86665 RepID=UPI002E22537F|nr:N-acetylmuramoyl-L-alanine amidase [Halalkalibacterium halodurans]MED4105497.1 N-acetylmuramoyl-L-alanine amidase [Halalkalibacterium halodurans]MED4109297.1 N-acetylmuramoyl-L-alanine amidase [Halalkalibacterium halodurans]MED4149689.1 N-acetylmuramoyl-L-alanine amidase [Halalkalibacterium halodurans]
MSKVQDMRNRAMGGQSKRSLSQIKYIAVHYSATNQGSMTAFENHWRRLGWSTGGYAKIILPDGTVQLCYDPNVITNGVRGHNTATYNICYVGAGVPNAAQLPVLIREVQSAMKEFNVGVSNVLGHREFPNQSTACPALNMNEFRKTLEGRPKKEVTNEKVASVIQKPSPNPLIKRGDKGENVRRLQNKLLAVGERLPRFGADGHFGRETEEAVKSFQARSGILVDGLVGNQTMRALDAAMPKYRRLLRNQSPMLRGNDVRAVQLVVGTVADGIYGQQTARAVREYQQRHKLKVDGIVGPQTWGHMFG